MIYFIIGASGSGKTACYELLKKLLPDYTIYDFDDIGVPDNADKKWRQTSTEKWIKQLTEPGVPKNICLLGQMVPGEILGSPSASKLIKTNILLLDCDDITRVQRLRERETYGINQDSLNWSSWLHMHCVDPQWEQHVIKKGSSDIMQFDRWDSLETWRKTARINIIDTSKLSIEQVAKQIAAYIRSNESNINAKKINDDVSKTNIILSEAKEDELDSIIALLADDPLGSSRERYTQPLYDNYKNAFMAIQKDENAKLILAKYNNIIIGVAQINFIAHLTYQGGIRAQIEGVRIHKDYRSKGIGKLLFEYLIALAKQHGCHLVQLTTDKSRPDAYKFYQKLGFVNSHEGFKLHLINF